MLLVGEAHPHRRLRVDPARERQVVGVGDAARQPVLLEHEPRRLEAEQAVERGRGDRRALEPVAALEFPAIGVETAAEEALAEPFVEQAPAIAAELR